MSRKFRILIVEDHLAMIEGYKTILSYTHTEHNLEFIAASSCQAAYERIVSEKENIDVILLDILLPPYIEKNIQTGDGLVTFIKKYQPDAKLIILTSLTQALLLYSLVKKLNPDGLLVKSDFSAEELIMAFESILKGDTFYSQSVHKSIREITSRDTYLDTYNRQIISLLDQGVKTKNLPQHLKLSLSAIDKRKAQIKDFLGIDKGNDEDILREARKIGFI